MSTKISDIIYDKYVGNNEPIINTNGMIKKMKEEEFNLNKELKRSKNDSKIMKDWSETNKRQKILINE